MNLSTIDDLVGKLEEELKKLKGIAKWKGNRPKLDPSGTDGPHFPPESIKFDAGILPEEQRVWVSFAFDEFGATNYVKATMQWDQVGTPGGNDVITYDGADVEADDFVLGHREGIEGFLQAYARAIFEFKFSIDGVKQHIRFDGG